MNELNVRWLSLDEVDRLRASDAAVLALVSPDRSALVRAWMHVLDANVLPYDFRGGEILELPGLGCVVFFEPEELVSTESAESTWPQLVADVAVVAAPVFQNQPKTDG